MNKTSRSLPGFPRTPWVLVGTPRIRPLGRLATEVASVLAGKNKPAFTPHLDTGDFVIIVNADKIRISGNKGRSEDLPPPLR